MLHLTVEVGPLHRDGDSVHADFRGHLHAVISKLIVHFKFRYVGLYRHLGICDQTLEHNIQIQLPCSDSMPWARFELFGGIFQGSCIEADPPPHPVHNRSCKSRSSIDPIAHQVSSGDDLQVQRARIPACNLLSDCTRTVAAVRLLLTPDARPRTRKQPPHHFAIHLSCRELLLPPNKQSTATKLITLQIANNMNMKMQTLALAGIMLLGASQREPYWCIGPASLVLSL